AKADPSLSDAGREQAADCGDFLKATQIDAVYSSPLQRARQTAEVIAERQGLAVQIVDSLIECDLGDWEGLDWNEVMEQHPQEYAAFMDDPGTHGYAGGEDFTQVADRVAPAFEELLRKHAGESIAVVAHNIVNRSYLSRVMDLPLRFARRIHQDNGGVNFIRMRDGTVKVKTMNAVFHLRRD
ncbi:MAG: histidine phosphatase family protein, partial [Planctomycetales bacterium]